MKQIDNTKEFTMTNRIYIYSNAGGNSYSISPTENVTDKKFEVEFIRADKVMEMLEQRILDASMTGEKILKDGATSSSADTPPFGYVDAMIRKSELEEIKKEIEAL